MSERSLTDSRGVPQLARLTARKREVLGGERRRQILGAALRVFARRGYDGATIEDIARTARLAEGTIYNYFRSKEDLLIHIPRHMAGPLFDELAARLPEASTPAEAEQLLVLLGRAMMERLTANVRFVKVFLSTLPRLSQHTRKEYARLMPLRVVGMLEAHLRQGVAAGLYRRDLEPAVAARAIPAMFMFMVMQEVLLGRPPVPFGHDRIVEQTVRLFLSGALAPVPPAGTQPQYATPIDGG